MSARMTSMMSVMVVMASRMRAPTPVAVVVMMSASTAVSVARAVGAARVFVVVMARLGGDDEPGVDDAGDPAEDGEKDVDQQRAAAAFAQEDGEGWEEDGDDGFAAADLGGLLLESESWKGCVCFVGR